MFIKQSKTLREIIVNVPSIASLEKVAKAILANPFKNLDAAALSTPGGTMVRVDRQAVVATHPYMSTVAICGLFVELLGKNRHMSVCSFK